MSTPLPQLKTFRSLVAFLILLQASALAQSTPPPGRPPGKSLQYPLANQFEHLSTKDGLSSNSVFSILQDREGYMWFGTAEGLNKYDGHTFTVFKQDPGRPNQSFRNSIITSLCEGDQDEVWASTEGGGLHAVNKKTGRITPHPIEGPGANRWNNQISVYKDSQGILWIGTFAGLARYDPARHLFTLYPSPIPEVAIKTVFEDRQHRFWVASHQGLFLFDRARGRFTAVPVPDLTGLQPTFISMYQDAGNTLWLGTATAGYSLFKLDLNRQPWRLVPYNPTGKLNPYVWRNTLHQDSSGILWVGTSNGLQAIDPSTDRVVTYQTDPKLAKGLGSSGAQAVYHDQSGAIWVGTDNGIDRQSINTKPFQTYQVKPNERMSMLIENRANAVFKDSRSQLWFSNLTSVYRLSAGQQQLDKISPGTLGTAGAHSNYVHTFLADGPDALWIGTADGLYHLDQRTGQYVSYPSEISAQYVSVQYIRGKPVGDLWIGGDGGIASFNTRTHTYTYYKYKPGTTGLLPDKYVYGLMVSQFGEVWVLVHQLGLCRFNPKTGKLTRYTAGPAGSLNTNDVLAIHEDRDGIIWVGTHMGGINRFDWRTGLFSAITHQDGIPGTSVIGITSDAAGHLWLSTNAGLCRVDPRTKGIHSYDVADGLPSNDFKHNAVFRQPNLLVFGTENGIVQFDPNRISDDTRPFPVYITQLSVLDKPRPITDSVIQLSHDENRLSFSFAALAYEQPDQNQFAYQLVGINPNWVPNENRQVANFTSLPPGTYTFRVKAANSNGFWTTNQASVQVIVQPPWWATWWAYVLYALLAGGAVWAYIRFYTSRLRQQQESAFNRREAEQLKTVDELKSRFFANITHEFRTPLSLILSPVEKLLEESRFDRPMLTLVHRNAEQLLRLINQLLDLSKLEANYMAISLRQGEVVEFVDHLVEVFQRAAEQKDVALIYTAMPFPAQSYAFDADKWEKIISNLLSNALKFTPSGGQVTLTLSPSPSASEPTAVHILLADSGIGIAPEQLPHIFDRFYQADTSSTRAYEGTGIGLALANELIDLLGGTIAVESTPLVGTTFRLTLPLLPVSVHPDLPAIGWSVADGRLSTFAPTPAVFAPVTTAEDGNTPRILVVEDNDELRAFLVGELTPAYHVFQASDGQEGWEMTQAELPDIVLTDVMMPRRDGHDLTRLIKSHVDTDHIAVVMLTAKAAQQSRIGGLQQGADDYLAKPFSIDELKLRLHNLVTRQQKLGDHYRQQFALPTPPDQPASPAAVNWLDSQDPFLLRIYQLLDKHLDDPSIGVDWLADQLAMNRKTLYRKVQSIIQLPPADLIRQYRLRKAIELLRAGHNVSETADLVGFNTPSHFTLVFKEFYQQTPSEFIASWNRQVQDNRRAGEKRNG
jgi:signal transduction histidine kinase/ligand-binding sensor domain-containing protein/CheY-like chemotaxis protein/AraC-like DNA-binding protein